MDLKYLEDLLRIKYENCKEREALPPDKWKLLNEVDPDGKTLLMKTAEGGTAQCVDLLLRCGVDVNARDRGGKRAIDHALDGAEENRKVEVILLLLQRDSLLPGAGGRERFNVLIQENEEFERLFGERERFHECVRMGDVTAVGDMLSNLEHPSIGRRYWVDREGYSALYTAGCELELRVWSFLKSKNFDYVRVEEDDFEAGIEEVERDKFNRALETYFIRIPKCHVFKLLSRSKVVGSPGGTESTLLSIYEKVDAVWMTSLLLQCLQDEPRLEIIFDMGSADVRCMYAGLPDGTRGLFGPTLDRVYAAGMVTEGFEEPDVVSNLVHEFTHKAMHLLFSNGGRPYKKGDSENEKKFEKIVSDIMSPDRITKCDTIIQRVKGYRVDFHPQELIVRVPEVVSKYHANQEGEGFRILENQAKDLFEYYEEHVIPEMENHIKKGKIYEMIPTNDFIISLSSNHKHDDVQVVDSIKNPAVVRYKNLNVLRVSNLALGISHLGKVREDLVCMERVTYQKYQKILNTELGRGTFKNLAVVWKEDLNNEFQSTCENLNEECSALVTLVIPKKFNAPECIETVHYVWSDLSEKTKEWVLDKTVNFQGNDMSLRNLMEGAVGNGNAGGTMDEMMNDDELSLLIDGEELKIGRPIQSALEKRRNELLHSHPQCCIPRRKRVRPVEWSREFFDSRPRDAFFVFDALKSDLEGDGFPEVKEWDGGESPDGTHCFLLGREFSPSNEDALFQGITEKLKQVSHPEADGGRKWQFAHFFSHEGRKKYGHLRSLEVNCNQATIVAGAPGCGKSVFVNMRALEGTKGQWVDVFELTNHEQQIAALTDGDLSTKYTMESFLFDLIKGQRIDANLSMHLSLEKNIFHHFCQSMNRVFIYFDGFDEICPTYRTKVTSFLEKLLTTTKVSFLVTTRLHECSELEEQLFALSQHLVPFNKEEQLSYFSSEWNASLQTIKAEERVKKIKNIISGLESNYNEDDNDEISKIIKELQETLERDSSNRQDINFKFLAVQMIEHGKSVLKEEGNLSEIPVNAWILAAVAFEDDFYFSKSLCSSELYKRLVEIKINLYGAEKAKVSGGQVADAIMSAHKIRAYEILKKYSAFVFLGDESCNLLEGEVHDMLRVGLLEQGDKSPRFVHRTIGEYFLSTWLLENAREKAVTKFWTSEILLKNEYEIIRRFIDSHLQSEHERKSPKVPLLRRAELPVEEEFVTSMQKWMFKCVLECNAGLLRYLADNTGESLAEVMLGFAAWDIRRLGVRIEQTCRIKKWNAFNICGGRIEGVLRGGESNVSHSKMDFLKFLLKMLLLIEERDLIVNFKDFITECGLQWTGVFRDTLWKEEEGRSQFQLLIEFLIRKKNALGETLKTNLLDNKGEELLVKSAIYTNYLFVSILESIVDEEDMRKSLPEKSNFMKAWTSVVKECVLSEVQRMWTYVEEKLNWTGDEEKRSFLKRKDYRKRNTLLAAFLNLRDPNVAPFVWELLKRAFEERDLKELLFDSLERVEEHSSKFNKTGFFKWLLAQMADGFLDEDDVSRLLLSKNKTRNCYVLSFHHERRTPTSLFRLQELLLAGRLLSADILKHMQMQYRTLAPSCFVYYSEWSSLDADFPSFVQREWEELSPSLTSLPFVQVPKSDSDGFLLHMSNEKRERIHLDQLKAFVVSLERQCGVEVSLLGTEALIGRIHKDWRGILHYLPWFRMGEEEEVKTEQPLVPFVFAVLSKFLSQGQVADLLLRHYNDFNDETTFHHALLDRKRSHHALGHSDPRAFLAYYDVARWSMGVDALWKVHSIGGGSRKEDETLLQLLQEGQDKGIFEFLQMFIIGKGKMLQVLGTVPSEQVLTEERFEVLSTFHFDSIANDLI